MTKAHELYQKVGALLVELPEKGESEHYDQAIYGIVMALDALVRVDEPEFEGTSFPIWVVESPHIPSRILSGRMVYHSEAGAQFANACLYDGRGEVVRGWAVTDRDIVEEVLEGGGE